MWIKWFPWKFIVRYVARAHGFLDPIAVLSYLRRFSQPSEVKEPIELLRAGVVFHARGLVNSRAIQTNLDWIWPYWVERQFDPRDKSFIPRAFSLTHINLTHRNWTAVGTPDCDELPIVDPRGLLTPFFDGWSLDGWILKPDGKILSPSQSIDAAQRLDFAGNDLRIVTDTNSEGMALRSISRVKVENHAAICQFALEGLSETGGWLIIALRPYNPEGVNFIHKIVLAKDRTNWLVDGSRHVMFHEPVEGSVMSQYHAGDAAFHLLSEGETEQTTDDVGMATAAAMYRLEPGIARTIRAQMRLDNEGARAGSPL